MRPHRPPLAVVMGTGGLSHQLDGKRAGFINKDFDLKFMDSMVSEPAWATKYSTTELVELSGTQGVELLNWWSRAARCRRRCTSSTSTTIFRSRIRRRD